MRIAKLTDAERDEFLSEKRLAILSTLRSTGAPFSTPLWFGWNGEYIEIFSDPNAGKVKRLRKDPRAQILVVNSPDESAKWVSFEGKVEIHDDGVECAKRLIDKYMGHADEKTRNFMVKAVIHEKVCEIRLYPEKTTSYSETF